MKLPWKKKSGTSTLPTETKTEIIGEIPVKRHFPTIKAATVGAVVIPLAQWLLTKEITAPAAIGSLVLVLSQAYSYTKVTPTKDIAPKYAEIATETAAGINAATAGAPGVVTHEATRVATDVVSQVAGIGADIASQVISSILAKRAAKKSPGVVM